MNLSLNNCAAVSIIKSTFIRNVLMVASGAAGAQLINFALSPIITRIYAPEAFGLLGTFTALASVIASVSALAYPIAIVLPQEDIDAFLIVRLSIYFSLAIAAVAAFFLYFFEELVITIFKIDQIKQCLILFPFFIIFSTWMQVVQQWLIREKKYNIISRITVVSSLLNNIVKILIGFFWPTAIILIILSVFLPVFYSVMSFFAKSSLYENKIKSNKSLVEIMTYYKDFPLYRAPQIFINTASQGVPILLLSIFFGTTAAGYYTLAYTVMGLPSGVIGKAVNDVFYPKIAEAAHSGVKLTNLIIKSTGMLLLVGMVPFGLIVVAGPYLFIYLFGDQWIVAGNYAQWLALFFLFNLINKPSVAAVPILGIQKGLLFYEIFSTGGKIIGLLIGFYFNSDVLAILLFSTIGMCAYLLMIIWILNCSVRYDEKTGECVSL